MFKFLRKKKKGQSTLEYAVLIIIVIGALLSIQVYIKRGIQGRLKSASDDIGDQYSVGNTNLKKVTRTSSNTRDTFVAGVTNSTLREPEVTVTTYNQEIMNVQYEGWGRG
jgi:cytoskeletal protein RodZ